MSYIFSAKKSAFTSKQQDLYAFFIKSLCFLSINFNFASKIREKQWVYIGAEALKFFQVYESTGAKMDQAYQWDLKGQR